MALAAVSFAVVSHSRFHLPAPLGSTAVSRFFATMGTLTPAPLPPGQVSLVIPRALPDVPSPTTPCAPVPGHASRSGRAWPPIRLVSLSAVLRISFVTSSLISRMKPNRVRVEGPDCPSALRTVRSLPVALHALSPERSYFPLPAGSSAGEGLSPSDARFVPSALVPASAGQTLDKSQRHNI